jgi:hypothetical protein
MNASAPGQLALREHSWPAECPATPLDDRVVVPGTTSVANSSGLWFLTIARDTPQRSYRSVTAGFIPYLNDPTA